MLQIAFIRENKTEVVAGQKKKDFKDAESFVDKVIEIDQQRRDTQRLLDDILAQSNTKAKEIGQLMKAGQKEAAEEAKAVTADLKLKSKELEDKLSVLEGELNDTLVKLPNLPHSSVPEGRTAEENLNVFEHGSTPVLYDGALPHWELIKKFDIIDFDLGVKLTGAGFPVYKGKGARLQRALINFFLDEALKAG